MAYHEVAVQSKDWSVNQEDACCASRLDELPETAREAIRFTASGHYANLATPEVLGHPEEGFMEQLKRDVSASELSSSELSASEVTASEVSVEEIRDVGECGCGRHVMRVFR